MTADPTLVAIVLGALWYLLGAPPVHREPAWRHAAFAGALLSVWVALDSPLERLAHRLFWAHMAQHLILITVTAPLLALAAPWMRFWRPLPLGLRRTLARTFVLDTRLAPVRRIAHAIATPRGSFVLFNGSLLAWHLPPLYDATLHNAGVHYAEHATFVAFGVLFWVQLVDSPPLRSRLDGLGRALYATGAMACAWVLAIVLAFASTPLYSYAIRPNGLSALTDQRIAAGVMWGPGSIAFTVVMFVGIYRWLSDGEARPQRAPRQQEVSR